MSRCRAQLLAAPVLPGLTAQAKLGIDGPASEPGVLWLPLAASDRLEGVAVMPAAVRGAAAVDTGAAAVEIGAAAVATADEAAALVESALVAAAPGIAAVNLLIEPVGLGLAARGTAAQDAGAASAGMGFAAVVGGHAATVHGVTAAIAACLLLIMSGSSISPKLPKASLCFATFSVRCCVCVSVCAETSAGRLWLTEVQPKLM